MMHLYQSFASMSYSCVDWKMHWMQVFLEIWAFIFFKGYNNKLESTSYEVLIMTFVFPGQVLRLNLASVQYKASLEKKVIPNFFC